MAARAVSTFSLILLLVALATAQPFTQLRDRVRGLPPEQALSVIAESEWVKADDEMAEVLVDAETEQGKSQRRKIDQLRAMIDLRALGEGTPSNLMAVSEAAKQIKRSPLYRDSGIDEESNWLGRALARLRNIRFERPKSPIQESPKLSIGPWLIYVVWTVLGLVAAYLIYLALRHVRWRTKLARKSKAVLEEDEPERTLDEWLLQADALAAEGRHREAVRALYLACLLRFDENRVARFIRGQTNWEHLSRIEASDRLPADIDFRPPTQAFDRIWYGKCTRGAEDVAQFRSLYEEITHKLAPKVAA